MKNLKFTIALLAIILVSNVSFAQLTGAQIMQKVYDNPKGNDVQGELKMVLTNKQGETRTRTIKQYIKYEKDVEKKIMFFMSPADVKGTSFMSFSYDDGRDEQWIYLPALKKVKRISSDGASDYFMGSDFTYDDLGNRTPDEDTHKLLRTETLNGKACYVVESIPKDEDYMYSKTITWVMKDNFIGLKREFYDEDGKLLKILTVTKYQKISGYWTILDVEMKNVQKNHKTTMIFSNVKINQGIPDSKFTQRSMMLGH